MNIIDLIKEKIADNLAKNAALSALLQTIPAEGVELEKASLSVSANMIDIDRPSRRDVEKCLYLLKGKKWYKTPAGYGDATMNYVTADEIAPAYHLRMGAAEPPGTCRVVEEEVEVPAMPAHKEIRKRLVCI